MEQATRLNYIERRKNNEYFMSKLYEKFGRMIIKAAELRKKRAKKLERLQYRVESQ